MSYILTLRGLEVLSSCAELAYLNLRFHYSATISAEQLHALTRAIPRITELRIVDAVTTGAANGWEALAALLQLRTLELAPSTPLTAVHLAPLADLPLFECLIYQPAVGKGGWQLNSTMLRVISSSRSWVTMDVGLCGPRRDNEEELDFDLDGID